MLQLYCLNHDVQCSRSLNNTNNKDLVQNKREKEKERLSFFVPKYMSLDECDLNEYAKANRTWLLIMTILIVF